MPIYRCFGSTHLRLGCAFDLLLLWWRNVVAAGDLLVVLLCLRKLCHLQDMRRWTHTSAAIHEREHKQ